MKCLYVLTGSLVDGKSIKSGISSSKDSQQHDDLSNALADLEQVITN